MEPDDYDIAGAATGVVDADMLLGPERVADGDVLIAMASSGLHSNGYSLVRSVVARTGLALDAHVEEFGRTLGEELLEPTRLYTTLCLDLIGQFGVGMLGEAGASSAESVAGAGLTGIHALSHVTGGGLGANLSRVLPKGSLADVDRGSWVVPPVFDWVRRGGSVSWEGMEDSLNLGVGMVGVVGAESADAVMAATKATGIDAWVLGTVRSEKNADDESGLTDARIISGTKGVNAGAVRLHGQYRIA